MTILGFDASSPPARAPKGYKVAFGYTGGPTPHIWTEAEWNRFDGMKKVPIHVASIAVGNPPAPEAEAFTCLEKIYALGVPKGHPIVWDMETAVNRAYVNRVYKVLHWAGYRMWVYGSASTVFGNPQCDGYHVADYRGIGQFMNNHPGVRATQYANGTQYDSNVVKNWQYAWRLKAW